MDCLTFTTKIIDAIAWPGVVVLVVVLFRQQIADLFPRLKNLKYKDFEAAFEAINEKGERINEKKVQLREKLTAGGLPGDERAMAAAQLEQAVRQEERIGAQRKRLVSDFFGPKLTWLRERHLDTIVRDIIGIEKTNSASELELMGLFHGIALDIRNGKYHPGHMLNSGSLTGLRDIILDDNFNLTPVGVATLKAVAKDLSQAEIT